MPWDYKTGNIPTSMKYLKPSIQKKAISIANHVLSSTGDEGKAIAIGISKAKSIHDKKGSLIKLEAKQVYREAARKHHPDMGGNAEKFKKLSTDWEGIENSNWFQKLAALQNNVIVKQILTAIKQGDKDFVEEKYDKLKEIMKRPLL
jgi:uncharacterized protein YdaT